MSENLLEHNHLIIQFDGACSPKNPGGVATAGWVFYDKENNVISTSHKVIADGGDKATNNVAEWSAIELALKTLKDRQWHGKSLLIRGDSNLVIQQLTENWQIKAKHLKPYKKRCLDLLKEINTPWEAEWVARNNNQLADDLSKQAYDEYRKRN